MQRKMTHVQRKMTHVQRKMTHNTWPKYDQPNNENAKEKQARRQPGKDVVVIIDKVRAWHCHYHCPFKWQGKAMSSSLTK